MINRVFRRLMSLVVSGIQPSVSAAYKALEKRTARAEVSRLV